MSATGALGTPLVKEGNAEAPSTPPLTIGQRLYVYGFMGGCSATINGMITWVLCRLTLVNWHVADDLPLAAYVVYDTFMQSYITYLVAGFVATVDARFGLLGLSCLPLAPLAPGPGAGGPDDTGDAACGGLGRVVLTVELDGAGTGLSLAAWRAKLCAAQRGAAGFALCCTALWGAVGVAFLFAYTDARDQTGMHHDGLLFKIAYAALLAGTTTPVVAYGALRTVGRNRARAAAEQHTAVNDENDAGGSNLV